MPEGFISCQMVNWEFNYWGTGEFKKAVMFIWSMILICNVTI